MEKEIIVCNNCGLTKREHKNMLFFGKDERYCHKFRKEITLKEYLLNEKRTQNNRKR